MYHFPRSNFKAPFKIGVFTLFAVEILLISIYIYQASFFIIFPADIFLWSESDFVNDILKYRVGYPIYSAQENNESSIYNPGTQMLTYLLAWLLGAPTVIPLYRAIQVIYALIASFLAVVCCRRLVEIGGSSIWFHGWRLWSMICFAFFFLVATNNITNPFIFTLHNDALALLVSIVAFWLLVEYVSTKNGRVLALMTIIPAAGFFVKQSLLIWAPLYFAYLAIFEKPRSLSRLIKFGFFSFVMTGVVVGACYLLWGEDYFYWILVLSKHPTSIIRSFQHLMDVWTYFAIGLLGGVLLLRRKSFNQLLGIWVIWLFLFLLEVYTSGIAWMLNHVGPGSMIAGIWFVAAMTRVWPMVISHDNERDQSRAWLKAGVGVCLMGLLFNGLGFVRVPMRPFSDDAYRYVKEIEREFVGQSPENILLDVGTWIYLREGVVMKDRGIAFGDRGFAGIGDFSGFIYRIKQKRYSKILVRNLQSPEFIYDHWMWPKSSNIRRILLEEYYEVRKIKAVQGNNPKKGVYYFFDEISVLVPKQK